MRVIGVGLRDDAVMTTKEPAGVIPLPDYDEYAWLRRCPQCGAGVRERCVMPREQARLRRVNAMRAKLGQEPVSEEGRYGRMHVQRTDAADRHRERDEVAMPWPEERVPGVRYDTLGGR